MVWKLARIPIATCRPVPPGLLPNVGSGESLARFSKGVKGPGFQSKCLKPGATEMNLGWSPENTSSIDHKHSEEASISVGEAMWCSLKIKGPLKYDPSQ